MPKKEDWLYRSPYFFFKALHSFREKNPDLADLIRVDLIRIRAKLAYGYDYRVQTRECSFT